ncbi:MAG TPA: GTPase Era [Polyangiaceae bacterium]|jgi:GTP-binding protein Era|nr:GTPase Era [Polyangiaceae bacterium]
MKPRPSTDASDPLPAGTDAGDPARAGRVALVGKANVGKSTLLNALLGERIAIVSPHPQTTREPVRGVLTVGPTQYVFVDTPGLHSPRSELGKRMIKAALSTARDADAVVLLVEAPRADRETPSFTAEREIIAQLAQGPKRTAILAINKIDRLDDKAALLPMMAALGDARDFAAVVPISAKRKDGIDALLRELALLLPEQPMLLPPDTLSDQPMRFFVAEFVREQILRHTKQEVPHGVAVVIERFEEGGPKTRIEATIHVAREAHKKIVIGAKGRMLKEIGTAARLRIEALLACKVSLQLWVRATPGWMDDPARLRELGFSEGQDGDRT